MDHTPNVDHDTAPFAGGHDLELDPRYGYLAFLLAQVSERTLWGAICHTVLEEFPLTRARLDELLDQLASQYGDNPPMMRGILGDQLTAFLVAQRPDVCAAPVPTLKRGTPSAPAAVQMFHADGRQLVSVDLRSLSVGAIFALNDASVIRYEVAYHGRNIIKYQAIWPAGTSDFRRYRKYLGELVVFVRPSAAPKQN